jgi:hypothetical protein
LPNGTKVEQFIQSQKDDVGLVRSESPLAYIGKVSRTPASGGRGVFTRPFRLGGKKEAAGAVVAVMLIWIMDIE